MLAFAGRLDEAISMTERGARKAREQGEGMAIPSWTSNEGLVYLVGCPTPGPPSRPLLRQSGEPQPR